MKIVSFFIATLLSVLILFNSFRVSITYAYYELDPVGFIEKLCENKDKPEMQCNGKCHLKKVAENSSNNEKAPEKAINFEDILLFIVNKTEFKTLTTQLQRKSIYNYNNLYAFYSSKILDHPPQV